MSAVIARTRDVLRLTRLLLGHPHLIGDLDRLGRPSVRFVPTADRVIDGLLALHRAGQPVTLDRLCADMPFRRLAAMLATQARLGRRIADPDAELIRVLDSLAGSPGGAR